MDTEDIQHLFPDILYEDNHLLVAIKPAGILAQGDKTQTLDMLTWLKDYLKQKYQKPGEVFLGLVHRLDQPVSGIMVFAKTSKCASRLSEQFRLQRVEKYYRCITLGQPLQEEEIVSYLWKNPQTNQVKVFSDSHEQKDQGKKSSLHYWKKKQALIEDQVTLEQGILSTKEVVDRKNLSVFSASFPQILNLLEIKLGTGRSHQIRAQLSQERYPILGDFKYGKQDFKVPIDICLQACKLIIYHPITKEKMHFEIPPPSCWPWNLF